MEVQPKISVIVPVYNCEKFLDGALCSVQKQTFTDFEVIMVNNRSTDSSNQIAKSFSEKDSRFKLIQCYKGTAGSTRNIGIRQARGKYIAFLDGDDKLMPDYLKKMYEAAEKNHADIVVCGFFIYYLNQKKRKKSGKVPDRIYNKREAMNELLKDRYMRFYLWNKLWRRSLFSETGIEIPDMYYEDAAVCPMLFSHAEKVVSISDYLYEYMRYNSKLLEVNMGPRRINDYINTIPIIRLYLEEQSIYRNVRHSFNRHIGHVVFSVPLLCMQSGKDLKDGVIVNSIRGLKKATNCAGMPADQLKTTDNSTDVIK